MEKTTTGSGGGGRTGVGGQYGRARKGTELVKGTRLQRRQRRRANGALWSDVGLCAANWAALTRIQNALSSHHSLSSQARHASG